MMPTGTTDHTAIELKNQLSIIDFDCAAAIDISGKFLLLAQNHSATKRIEYNLNIIYRDLVITISITENRVPLQCEGLRCRIPDILVSRMIDTDSMVPAVSTVSRNIPSPFSFRRASVIAASLTPLVVTP